MVFSLTDLRRYWLSFDNSVVCFLFGTNACGCMSVDPLYVLLHVSGKNTCFVISCSLMFILHVLGCFVRIQVHAWVASLIACM
jgi:hypothetical protein